MCRTVILNVAALKSSEVSIFLQFHHEDTVPINNGHNYKHSRHLSHFCLRNGIGCVQALHRQSTLVVIFSSTFNGIVVMCADDVGGNAQTAMVEVSSVQQQGHGSLNMELGGDT